MLGGGALTIGGELAVVKGNSWPARSSSNGGESHEPVMVGNQRSSQA